MAGRPQPASCLRIQMVAIWCKLVSWYLVVLGRRLRNSRRKMSIFFTVSYAWARQWSTMLRETTSPTFSDYSQRQMTPSWCSGTCRRASRWLSSTGMWNWSTTSFMTWNWVLPMKLSRNKCIFSSSHAKKRKWKKILKDRIRTEMSLSTWSRAKSVVAQ